MPNEETTGTTGTETNGTTTGTTTTGTGATSVINLALEWVINTINAMNNFATMTRGALGSANGLVCEVAPSNPETVFLDKNWYAPIVVVINGKHTNLLTLTDCLNNIMDTLSRRTSYGSGTGWKIVDITNTVYPRVIGREENNAWVMACEITVKIERKDA